MSSRPSPLKSPTTICAAWCAQSEAKLPTSALLIWKEPSPLENAIGIVCQFGSPRSAMSERPSPLKSPTRRAADDAAAQNMKLGAVPWSKVNVPSPFENAILARVQLAPPIRAMSVRPSLLTSPVSLATFGVDAQLANVLSAYVVALNEQSPLDAAKSIPGHPGRPASAMSSV